MIVTTLLLSFLLSLLPLVIGTLSFRYAANPFSRGILALSAVGFVLGLTQFSLLFGTFYRLFPATLTKQASVAMQYINISGGIVMILAGLCWIGYFRTLARAKEPSKQPAPLTEVPATKAKSPRPSRKKPNPADDWFADELLPTRTVRMAAKISPKKPTRSMSGALKRKKD